MSILFYAGSTYPTVAFAVGLLEVETTDNQDKDARAPACRYRLPGRGGDRLL